MAGPLAEAYVQILADTGRFENDLKSKIQKAGTQAGKNFNTSFNKQMGRAKPPVARLERSYSAAGTKAGRRFAQGFAKTAGSVRVGTQITAKLGKSMDKQGKSVGKRLGTGILKGLAAPISLIGKAVTTALSAVMDVGGGMGKGGGAFGALAVGAGALTAALSPLLGFVAALPAALSGAIASAATLAVAFRGVGDAISAGWSGDMAKFEESLRKLAPSAQTVVRDIVGLKPAFDELKASVQGAFFDQLVGQMSGLAQVITGPLKTGMTALSTELGKAAAALVGFFQTPGAQGQLQALFTGLADSVARITPGLVALTRGFLDMSVAGAQALGGLGPVLTSIGDAMSRFATGGGLTDMLTSAANAARMLWAALQGLWPGLQAMGEPLGIIGQAMRNALVPAFQAFGTVLSALAPVFTQVAKVFSGVLGAAIPPLTAALSGLGQIFSALLLPVITALSPIVLQIANALGPVLSQAVATLVPQLVTLATSIGSVLGPAITALMPVIQMLLPIITGTLGAAVGFIQGVVTFLTGIFKTIGAVIQGDWAAAWEGVKMIGIGIWEAIVNGVQLLLIGRVLGVLRGGIALIRGLFAGAGQWLVAAGRAILQGLLNGLKSAWGAVTGFVGGIGTWIKNNKGPISYDRRLLIPAGKAIMAGFNQGLQQGFGQVQNTIHGVNRALPGLFDTQSPQLYRAAAAGLYGSGIPGSSSGVPGLLGDRADSHDRTTTVSTTVNNTNSFHVSTPANPDFVARRTADRIARLSIA